VTVEAVEKHVKPLAEVAVEAVGLASEFSRDLARYRLAVQRFLEVFQSSSMDWPQRVEAAADEFLRPIVLEG
jgi:hypothetical protein